MYYYFMVSKWFRFKIRAVELRLKGKSIKEIEKTLKIPRSTLSGWLREIKLTEKQRQRLDKNWQNALIKARKKAVIWHKDQKKRRLIEAKQQALSVLSQIDTQNKYTLELALSMLYLGEGDKTQQTSMGSSSPIILKFFIKALYTLYGVEMADLKCELHLRSDQNEKDIKQYWSDELGIPYPNFQAYKDKRTAKSRTYHSYKGVCVVRCGNIALQRKIVHLGQEFCKIVALS